MCDGVIKNITPSSHWMMFWLSLKGTSRSGSSKNAEIKSGLRVILRAILRANRRNTLTHKLIADSATNRETGVYVKTLTRNYFLSGFSVCESNEAFGSYLPK